MHDLFFIIFMTIQEVNDTSYSHTLVMKVRFTDRALAFGSLLAHVAINSIVMIIFWTLFSFFNARSLKLFGCFVIYFIVSHELIINALKNMKVMMEK